MKENFEFFDSCYELAAYCAVLDNGTVKITDHLYAEVGALKRGDDDPFGGVSYNVGLYIKYFRDGVLIDRVNFEFKSNSQLAYLNVLLNSEEVINNRLQVVPVLRPNMTLKALLRNPRLNAFEKKSVSTKVSELSEMCLEKRLDIKESDITRQREFSLDYDKLAEDLKLGRF